MSSSTLPAHLPRHGEIKALIAFAQNQGANGHDDFGKAERMLQKMKDRGVSLNKVRRAANEEIFDDRNAQEFLIERIRFVETGAESPNSQRRRASRTATNSAVAKGRRTKRHSRRSSSRSSRRNRGTKRRH
jgi:phage terminase Nu1 subunit (DNA packaging protein)